MSWDVWVAIALGGAVGAGLRHLAAVGFRGALVGVFVANLAGAGLLGLLVALGGALPSFWFALLGTGLCGALTTYSTFAVQIWELWHQNRTQALGYLFLTTGAGGLAALMPVLLWGH